MNQVERLISELCPNGIKYTPLKEVATLLNGYSFKSNLYDNKGVRVIRISDVQKGKISDKSLKYYPIDFIDKIQKYLLFEGDLVISLTGNVGRVAILNRNHIPAGLNQRVACIRANQKYLLTKFLFYYLDPNSFEILAMDNSTGGGQKNLSTNWLKSHVIPTPP